MDTNTSDIYETLKAVNGDPEVFEQLRLQILEEFFQSLPDDQKQKAQWAQLRLNQELANYKDPIARMNKMVELFWQGFTQFNQELNNPKSNQLPQKHYVNNITTFKSRSK